MTAADRPLAGARWLRRPSSRRIMACLAGAGGRARFVGGCVRDTLLDPGLERVDIDIATTLKPDAVLAALKDAGIRALPTGIAHGTVTAFVDDTPFEITTLRHDVACFGRHAEVAFTTDFDADAARRDFTINAMSCDVEGRLFDPFGGHDDLLAGRVRFVGEPAARIREDYLRILRFFRFHARFGKGPPDPATLRACAGEREGLARLSGERVRAELFKLLVQPGAPAALGAMAKAGILGLLLEEPADIPALARLHALVPDADALLRLATLVHGAAEPGRLAARLRLSNAEAARLGSLLVRPHADLALDAAGHRRMAYRVGVDIWRERLCLSAAVNDASKERLAAALAAIEGFAPPVFPLGGQDLIAREVTPGPAFRRLLESVRSWWIERDFGPGREACLAELDRRLAAGIEAR